MARRPAFAKVFAGRWRIVEMDTWSDDVLDVGGEAYNSFTGAHDGEIAFVAVEGSLDVRYGKRDRIATAEFTSRDSTREIASLDEDGRASERPGASSGTSIFTTARNPDSSATSLSTSTAC